MSRRKSITADAEFFLVNVVYADGTLRSNRKVPRSQLSGFDDKADIRQAIEVQDRKISGMSGQPPGSIASIVLVKKAR